MKIKYLLSLLLTTIFLTVTTGTAYAQNNNIEVISTTDDNNIIVIQDDKAYGDTIYVGQSLKDYSIVNVSKDLLDDVTVRWENPDYQIREGQQVVNLIYRDKTTNEKIVFSVLINGTPYLSADKIYLQPNIYYNLNIIGKSSFDQDYQWSSEDEEIARVDRYGNVTGVSKGVTTIHCKITFLDGTVKDLTSLVFVGYEDKDNDLSLNMDKLILRSNEEFNLNIYNKIPGSDYVWHTKDNSIVEINHMNGMVIARGEGETTVSCLVTLPDKTVITLECDILVY
ncbi:Ig-like domain-containing protein [Mobilitalea sibirica]|uniref:Ig-like domain-containing protein n=1 Tax=Mobilitalea sibirica TaxID=1462919 RepID=A0A8J7KT52_9FIRM|nr:Ig-like domain-containing protein [Mobilitalea sibirica]MBH1941001.1 Ig-like domain-containing protein [Mobilitalea sibirica]